jgi:hypothetical protein
MFRMKNNIIGKRVKEGRLKLIPHMTQAALAVRLQLNGSNISRTGVAKIEMGLRCVTDIEIKLISIILNVSINWLFAEEEK